MSCSWVLYSRQPEEHWWGNMPAMSLLAREEGDEQVWFHAEQKERPLSLNALSVDRSLPWRQVRSVCFAASGDLRNVITTVNALPADGSRSLTVLVNDRNPRVAVRNFVLLLLLLEKGEVRGCPSLLLRRARWSTVSATPALVLTRTTLLCSCTEDSRPADGGLNWSPCDLSNCHLACCLCLTVGPPRVCCVGFQEAVDLVLHL